MMTLLQPGLSLSGEAGFMKVEQLRLQMFAHIARHKRINKR
jgi:hypothetical protein